MPFCCSCNAPAPIKIPIDLNEQSTALKGHDIIHVSKVYKEAKDGKFISYLYEDAKTLYESFRRGAKKSNNGQCLGYREPRHKSYQWLHYNEALLRAKNFGSGLIALGLQPGSFIGIYSANCPEWILSEQAAYCFSMIVVPLYDTLGPDACAYIIKQTDISVVICENEQKCLSILDTAPRCLKKIIIIKEMRQTSVQLQKAAKNRGVEILKFSDVEVLGAQKSYPEVPPKTSDLCTVAYTSGTTGNPKGVMLTHENVVATISAVMFQLADYKPTNLDVMISFLPLALMLERTCENAIFMVGGCVGYYSGNIRTVSDDMRILKPSIIPAVPRLLNKMFDKIQNDLGNSFIKRCFYNMALTSKENEIKRGILRTNTIWDRLLFRKLQESYGGHCRLMIVGSAPLAGNVLRFARCALGCLILEGYGQTECTAPITLSIQGDFIPEHVGPPIPCCSVKLADVPDMEYYASANQGEICVKGKNVFIGYYKEPQLTDESRDDDDWHRTGDIGMWLPNGTLKIIDRKKHIFKLSQGEYIAPEKIENIYLKSQYVHQVFVYGESLKSCIVAVVVPDVDVVKCWATEHNIPGTLSVLCANKEIKKLLFDDMLNWGKEAGLKSFEQVKDIYLHPDPFSVQNGLLTPAIKLKRPQLRSYFKPQLEDLYLQLS